MKQTSTRVQKFLGKCLLRSLMTAVMFLLISGGVKAQNPLAPANNFMIFVQNNSTVSSGDVTGPFATGGNLTVNGNFQSAGNYQGTYRAVNTEALVGTFVGGSVLGSSYFQTNGNSFAKVGSLGSSTCDASGLLFIKNGANNVLSGNNAQTCSQVTNLGSLNFGTAFTTLKSNAACLAAKAPTVTLPTGSNPVISLATGVNYLTLSATQLNSSINLTTSPAADATHILVINCNVGSSFTWSGGFQLQTLAATPYVLMNFNTTATINFNQVGSAIDASILAPFATFIKNSSANIEGQIIASNYHHVSGEVHASPFLGSVPCTSQTASCSCPGNLVVNPSFEDGITGWGFSGGTLTDGTGAVVCGTNSGDFNITNASSNYVSQTIGTDLQVGTVINAKVYAGVHDNAPYQSVQIMFFDVNWNLLSGSNYVEVNKDLDISPVGPQLYTFSATVPTGTKYTQVGFNGNALGYVKTDQWCVTSTPPATNCVCTNSTSNLLTNGSFENGTTGWSWAGGNLTTGTGYIVCGAANAFLDWTSGTAFIWQQVNATAGTLYNASGYIGTHTAGLSCNPTFYLSFYNSSNVRIGRVEADVTTNVDVSPNLPGFYSLSSTAPAGTAYLRVEASTTCNTLKLDAFCLTASCTAPATPTTTIVHPTCTVPTGRITITGPTGSGITYSVDNSAFTATTVYSGLAAGPHTVEARNSGGCESSVTVTIAAQPASPATPTTSIVHPTCTVPTGTVTITGPTGTGITYSVDNSAFTATTVYSGLAAGPHTVEARK